MKRVLMAISVIALCMGSIGTAQAVDLGRFCWQAPNLFVLDVAATQQTAPGAVQQLGFSGTLSNQAGTVIGYVTGSGSQNAAAGTMNAGLTIVTDPASAFAAGTSTSAAVCSFTLPGLAGNCAVTPTNGAIPIPAGPIALTASACP
ncbi:MAG: hypothetical protein ACE5DY_06440 [Mariprofundaceae bacterium]